MPQNIEYLEVTQDNQEELSDLLGRLVDENSELECDVDYELLGKDPAVGINERAVQVFGVRCEGHDVSAYFDLDKLEEAIMDEIVSTEEGYAEDAADAQREMYLD